MPNDTLIPTSAPADLPTIKIRSGGTDISAEYQVKSVTVGRAFNRLATADILICDGDPAAQKFKASDAAEFLPGKEIEIVAGYHGKDSTIFKGVVIRHALHARNHQQSYLQVECRDQAVKLTGGRKSAYFYDMTDSDVIEKIAGDAGLQKDIEATKVKHKQMVQFSATDWDLVVMRAEANGKLVVTLDGKLVVKAPDAGKQPVLSLAYGRNVLDFEATMDAREQFASVQSASWDAANQELLEIDGATPKALAPGNVSGDDLAKVLGIDPLKLQHSGQIADSELHAWADGQRLKSAFGKVRGRARIQGYGSIVPGDVVEFAGVGDRFNGKAVVSGVRHQIDTRNWETDLTFGLSADWFANTDWRIHAAPAGGLLPGITGLQVGLVTSLEDPDGEDRIQVRTPVIGAKDQGVWARVATLDAGKNRGTFFRPEIDDEVVLGFLNDDPRNPIVLGMLNSSANPAPLQAKDANPQKGIFTREKIKLLFDDEKKVLTIETPGGNTIVVSDDKKGITMQDQNGNKVVLDSSGITLDSAKDVIVKAGGDVKIEGTNVNTSASAQLQAKGSSGAEFSSGGNTTVKGSMVLIN